MKQGWLIIGALVLAIVVKVAILAGAVWIIVLVLQAMGVL